MEELSFKLEVFEGPLDLLLSLIAKHKLNIYDIEISVLLEQFLLYLDKMQDADIEVAGEFLEMAARLIYIKSSALLPKHEAEEMKKELEGALIEYAQCKAMAEKLGGMFIGYDIFVRDPMQMEMDTTYRNHHELYDLIGAMQSVYGREKRIYTKPASLKPIVAHSFVSVFTKVIYVLRRIRSGGQIEVNSLYKGQNRSEQVATFLALLELSKYGRVSFSEDNRYLVFLGRQKNRSNEEESD